jgi:hypothetical protein
VKLLSYPSRRTGPAQVKSCGCNVLPWEACECEKPWDAGLSLDRVIERAQLDMTQYPDEPAPVVAEPRPPLNVLMVLARCRRMAEREMSRGRKHAKEAKRLIADIEAVAQGGLPC